MSKIWSRKWFQNNWPKKRENKKVIDFVHLLNLLQILLCTRRLLDVTMVIVQPVYQASIWVFLRQLKNNVITEDHVNQVLSNLRIESRQDQTEKGASVSTTSKPNEEMKEARATSDAAVLEAERFKATINPRSGIKFNNDNILPGYQMEQLKHMRYLDSEDDEFFHTTCHIDQSLRDKIKRGEFVELEKLIQKRTQFSDPEQDRRMQLVNRDGESYFVKTH